MTTYLDLAGWPRRQHFDWFRAYERPFFNVCAPVDVTQLSRRCHESGAPFSLAYHYASIRTANEIEPFRYRLRGDRVVVHERLDCGTTIAVENDLFVFAYVEYAEEFGTFQENFEHELARITALKGRLEPAEDRDDLVHYSVLPWLAFTSFSHARRDGNEDSIPKIVFGKTYESEGRLLMPHSVEVHHALMDGLHVGRYFERLQNLLDSLPIP